MSYNRSYKALLIVGYKASISLITNIHADNAQVRLPQEWAHTVVKIVL